MDKILVTLIMVLAVVGLLVVVILEFTTKEGFSKAQRIKLLSKASMENENKEGFVGSRSDMMFKGQYDYLLTKPEGEEKTEEVVEEKQDSQHSATTSEASTVAKGIATQIVEDVQNQASTAGELGAGETQLYDTEENIETHNEIVSTAGKALSQEKFSKSRVYNDFNTLLVNPSMNRLSSQVAQSEENTQKTVDMLAMENKEGFNRNLLPKTLKKRTVSK